MIWMRQSRYRNPNDPNLFNLPKPKRETLAAAVQDSPRLAESKNAGSEALDKLTAYSNNIDEKKKLTTATADNITADEIQELSKGNPEVPEDTPTPHNPHESE